MSLSLGIEGRAALRAMDACDRMLVQLRDAIDRHEYAASLARPDWEGPHRDAFEDRFDEMQHHLRRDEDFVLQVQLVARDTLLDSIAELLAARVMDPW